VTTLQPMAPWFNTRSQLAIAGQIGLRLSYPRYKG